MKTILPTLKNIQRLILPLLFAFFIITLDSCIVIRPAPRPPHGKGPHAQGPPPWAPAHGYRAKTQYVFFPTIGIYYDLNRKIYTYPDGNKWITVNTLPSKYANYDLKKITQEELREGINPESHHRGRQGKGAESGGGKGNAPGNKGNAPSKKGPPSDKGKPQGKPK